MTYSTAFVKAVALILRHEGGFTLNPDDDGNWTGGREGVGELKGTNLGISAASYPSVDIKGLTRDQAIAIYHRDYWQAIRGDELPPALGILTFDMAVNGGPGAAIRLLQRALRVEDDGKLGPVTLAKAQAVTDARDAATRYTRERILHYVTMRRWLEFGRTWTQRSLETLVEAVA